MGGIGWKQVNSGHVSLLLVGANVPKKKKGEGGEKRGQKPTKMLREKRKTKQRTIVHERWFGFYQYRGAGGQKRSGRPRVKNKTHQREWVGVSKKPGRKKKKKKTCRRLAREGHLMHASCILFSVLTNIHSIWSFFPIILYPCFCPCLFSSVFFGRRFLSGEPATELWQTI